MVIGMGMDFIAPLFVPGNRPERFPKAASSGADAIIIDLEDAVPARDKAVARSNVRTGFTDLSVVVRINAHGTPFHDEDIVTVAGLDVAAVMVPKAEPGPIFDQACERLGNHRIVALIETAAGLAGARELARHGHVARLAFGSIDYCADLDCSHTREALLSARSELVLASRLAGLPAPVDGVTTDLHDPRAIKDDTRHAQGLGFGAKLCIHPSQILSVLDGFRPTEKEIEWATRILETDDGASVVDGAMVDEPVRIRARRILARVGNQ